MNIFSPMSALNPNERQLSNRLTGIIAGLGGALALALSPVASANEMREHERLWNTLQNNGITTILNSPAYCDEETAGSYSSGAGVLFVCQENARVPYKEVLWTDYDLDTLRHEAHHVVQDCIRGGLGDGLYETLFDGNELTTFVTNAVTDDEIDWVIKTYASQGASEEVIVQELEAFAAAKSVSAATIADAVNNTCGYPQ